jgi:uncharacterized tellurite resistance protein B-like protein
VLSLITALAGLIWAISSLQKSGFDIGSLNPFLWHRRNAWRKKYDSKPLYKLSDPLDVAALLLLGIVKCEGEVSAEQKKQLTAIFETDFHLSSDDASDQLLASSHLLRDEIYIVDNLDKILEKSRLKFSTNQISSLISLMKKIAKTESPINQEQHKLIDATQKYFAKLYKGSNFWQ